VNVSLRPLQKIPLQREIKIDGMGVAYTLVKDRAVVGDVW
jgi:hypothetical protein